MAEHNLDALVIGGGPGGYTAAIRLSQLGFEVGIAERDELGGGMPKLGLHPNQIIAAYRGCHA